ncbi:MAG: hypothetical protein RL726_1937 [Actinomycetota bacterium]|jgi:mRNA interferase MazF
MVDLEPAVGQEANKRRPAVVISNDGANTAATRLGRGVITVVPITTNTEQVHPFQVLLLASESGLSRDSKAQCEQVRSVSIHRVGESVGIAPPRAMLELNRALVTHLGL